MDEKYRLSITGSLTKCAAVLLKGNGAFINYKDESSFGLHFREMADDLFSCNLFDLVGSLIRNAALELQVPAIDVSRKINNIAICISGLDERFDNILMKGHIDSLDLLNEKTKLSIRGIAEACHSGAFYDSEGILVRLGIGCSVFARNNKSQKLLTNAWGFLPGDLGSFYHIGQQVLHVLTKANDGRASEEEKKFSNEALSRLGAYESAISLFEKFSQHSFLERHKMMIDIAKLSNSAIKMYKTNGIAREILRRSIRELVIGIKTVMNELNLKPEISIIIQGDMLSSYPELMEIMSELLTEEIGLKFSCNRINVWNRTIGAALFSCIEDKCDIPILRNKLTDNLRTSLTEMRIDQKFNDECFVFKGENTDAI